MKTVTQAVIFVGGLGTRLRPLTHSVPKPMIRIHKRPFLEYIIRSLQRNNITRIVLLVGYLHEQIEEYFGNGARFGVSIDYSYAPAQVDTGLRLKLAERLLDQIFLLLYGDNYWPLEVKKLWQRYMDLKTEALVTVYDNADNATKNNILVDSSNIVALYDRTRTKNNANGVDIGYFLIKKSILVDAPKKNFSFEDTFLPLLIEKRQLAAYVTPHKYYGLSNPKRIPMIENYFRKRKVVFLDRDGVINAKAKQGEYISTWKNFQFLPQAKEGLLLLSNKGYEIYIVSNQAGVARKVMKMDQVELLHRRLNEELSHIGVHVQDFFVCPHGWDEGCECRKPKAGLFFRAASKYYINLYESFCAGDDLRDIIAGNTAGCKTIFIGTLRKKIYGLEKPHQEYKSLYDAARHL